MRYLTTLLITLFVAMLTSCDALSTVSSNSVTSQGAPYELIVVCNQAEWEGALGDTLKATFREQIPYLTQAEPLFTTYRVTHQSYENLIPRHRNIFIVNIVTTLTEPSIIVEYDVNATPQVIMTLQAQSPSTALEYFMENRSAVMQILEGAERSRDVAYANKFNVASIEKIIKDKFDVDMKIPQGYTLRSEMQDFVWISYEYPIASQGVLIYSYPAENGVQSLKWEPLLAARNRFAALVPGPSANSFMSTFIEVEPDYRALRINGRAWAELRGLWQVTGDFMGGPYVSYSTIDERTGRIFTIDGYVYSPKHGKRNFLRGIEHLVYGVSIPAE